MKKRKGIFVYPITKESFNEESNTYVKQLIRHLGQEFNIINGITEVGLLDALLKFKRTDVFYFNWIENLPAKRFGFLQVALLILLLLICKVFNKKVVWFVHNNISHDRKNYQVKKFIVKLMAIFSDLIFAHSAEIKLKIPRDKLFVFHHPIELYQPLNETETIKYDLLIWGAVSPYKGIAEFVKYASSSQLLVDYKILIAGKFGNDEYYKHVLRTKSDNVTVMNKFIAEKELIKLFAQSRYILFTYVSASVISSAALCKSLSFGKEVIAPNVGSFKELGEMDLVHTYDSFPMLECLLQNLKENKEKGIDQLCISNYVLNTNWNSFSFFIFKHINQLFIKRNKFSLKPYLNKS